MTNTHPTYTLEMGETPIHVTFHNWAEQANGSCQVQIGETTVLATATMSDEEKDLGFFPLTVDYEERYYAAGEIGGSRFMRREGKPSEKAVANARFIDRTVRPLFPEGLNREVQIVITVLSFDDQNDPDITALIAASLALGTSDIPWDGPVGPVRVGSDTQGSYWQINPTYSQREGNAFDVVYAGPLAENGEEAIVNMIEGDLKEVPDETALLAFDTALPRIAELCSWQADIIAEQGKEKDTSMLPDPAAEDAYAQVETTVREAAAGKLEDALFHEDKQERSRRFNILKREILADIAERYPDDEAARERAKDTLDAAHEEAFRRYILEEERRPDGRALDEVRSLACHTDVVQRTHGAALFERGITRTLSILTLGAPGDEQLLEGMEGEGTKRFMHHYNFPPYAPGEVRFMGAPKRREIGHGLLAERALTPVLPGEEDFPYTIRIVSEVLSSNGSTSMASTCSSCLTLMDAGVPISEKVAGIAVGLVMDKTGDNYKVLTDIQGPEDHHGDMDFKAAGTPNGLTVLQMDTKVRGITRDILEEALRRGKSAREVIFTAMDEEISGPRTELAENAPRIDSVRINPEKIGDLIGPSGKTINKITEETGVDIDISDEGLVHITAESGEAMADAKERIHAVTAEPEVGDVYTGKVTRILNFGAMMEYAPGKTGLIHISKLAPYHVDKVTDIVNIGDTVTAKVVNIDDQGRVDLSLKDAPDQ